MPNQQRGEIEVTLGGKRYTLRPTFEAIAEAEDKLGVGITGVAIRFSQQKHGLKDVASIIYAGLVGAGNTSLSYDQVGTLIQKEGYSKFVQTASDFLLQALVGGNEEANGSTKKKAATPSTLEHPGAVT